MRIELQKLRMLSSDIGSSDGGSPKAVGHSDHEGYKKIPFNKDGSYASSNIKELMNDDYETDESNKI